MKLRSNLMLLLLFIFVSCFSVNAVFALELDDSTLDSEIADVSFVDGCSIVKGNLVENLTVDSFLLNFTEEFVEKYNINSITVMDGEDVLSGESFVTNDKILTITLDDDTVYEYVIKVVGDLNDDGIVNDSDVELLIDGILALESDENVDVDTTSSDVDVKEDINGDNNIDVVDVTHLTYSINEGNWGIGQVELQDIISSLNADDVIYVDDTVEVIYKVTGLDFGVFKGISGNLNYDKSLLELSSVFTDCMYGYLNEDGKFLYVFDEEAKEVLITFSFKVIDRGSGNVNVSLDDLMAAIDGVKVELDEESLSKGMQIEEYGKGGDEESSVDDITNTDTSNADIPVSVPVSNVVYHPVSNYVANYVSLSSNNYIRSLEIKNQKIDFDKEVLEYSILVGNKVRSLDLTVVLDDESASYEVLGNENFKTGKNVVTIRVTAEDGSIRDYVINVTKNAENTKSVDKNNNFTRYVIVGLIVLIIAGLVYVIFNDDEDDENKDSKK